VVLQGRGDTTMSRFYIRWHMNPHAVPLDPKERVDLWMRMLEGVRKDLASGNFKEWGICSDISAGYCMSELDEEQLHTVLLKYVPYISFNIKPVLTVDQSIGSINRATAAAKRA